MDVEALRSAAGERLRTVLELRAVMDRTLTLNIGVVVTREAVEHPWREHRWRPLRVTLGGGRYQEWQEVERGRGYVHYFAGHFPLHLHVSETHDYHVNFANGEPSVYVVMRETEMPPARRPIAIDLVTASPFRAQASGTSGQELIESVRMPEALLALSRKFLDRHHADAGYAQRQRASAMGSEEHRFGPGPRHFLHDPDDQHHSSGGSDA